MKLTQFDRKAFVKAVMDDVPTIDHTEAAEKMARDAVVALMPADVAKVYKNHPGWLDKSSVVLPDPFRYVYMPCDPEANWGFLKDKAPDVWAKLEAMAKEQSEAQAQRSLLKTKLTAAINACTTLKRAKEILPEFEKYLPQERDGVVDRSMPVVANLVADLTKAGWPKDAKKPAKRK